MTDATATRTSPSSEAIDASSYELLRNRLLDQSKLLATQTDVLNTRRVEVFGGSEMSIAGQVRVRTENNCVPRDIVAVGEHMLFGYNVFVGMRKQTSPDDVFAMHDFVRGEDGVEINPLPVDAPDNILTNPSFREDFQNLYRYMKDSRLLQLRDLGTRILAIFQIGSTARDIKAFRWDKPPGQAPRYIDAEGAREHSFPPSHDFSWSPTGRDDFIFGEHPHVSILDKVFVETVGGDLTVKVENNTADGGGVYSEPVVDRDQTLDDGKILFAEVGTLVLLKVLPFAETEWRYLVFNTRTHTVDRIDAIGRACVQLPEDHGIIFPGGYYLQSGETKSFEGDVEGMAFLSSMRSPNGEDVMYVFYEETTGRSILLPYNLIRKEVQNPVHCHGFTVFDDGTMVVFRADSDEPTRVHPMQVWNTPFCSDEWAAQSSSESEHAGSYLVKVGNSELVRGISDCHSIRRLIQHQEPSSQIYEDLIGTAQRQLDAYYWLGHAEIGDIAKTLKDILATAELIVDEFEKVQVIQKAARDALAETEAGQTELFKSLRPDGWRQVDQYVDGMSRLRSQRGHLITLKEMRYVHVPRVEEMEQQVIDAFEKLTERAVQFLIAENAFAPYQSKYDEVMTGIEAVTQSNQTVALQEQLDTTSEQLDMLTEVIGSLQIDDPAARTTILEQISEVFALFNRAKATLTVRRKELLSKEGVAEFGAQFKLFAQSVASGLAAADSPEKCDEQLTRLLMQLEELEARFSEFDDFLGDLAAKREEVYEAFNTKKQTLMDQRQRRADNVSRAAERIIAGVSRRASGFTTLDELNAYFAADAMILKLRDLAKQLRELGDGMRAEQVVAKIKAARDDASRSLRDKTELFEDGANVIKFGKHRFAVNTQDLELTMLPRDGEMFLHLTGTQFFEQLDDVRLEEMRDLWEQTLVSETADVYRGEYLAACMLFDASTEDAGLSMAALTTAQLEERLIDVVREYANNRYDEGYERGVHDADAALILDKLLGLHSTAGLLRFGPGPRTLAAMTWAGLGKDPRKASWERTGSNLGRLREAFGDQSRLSRFAHELADVIESYLTDHELPHYPQDVAAAGRYLAEHLAGGERAFATSADAVRLRDKLFEYLELRSLRSSLEKDLDALSHDLPTRYRVALGWVESFVEATDNEDIAALKPVIREAVGLLLTEGLDRAESGALSGVEVTGLLGQHSRIDAGKLYLRLDDFLERLGTFRQERVPRFVAFRKLRHELVEEQKYALRLSEFKPRVLSSFVRNKLINDVYLPIIGDNLAKQIGAAGDDKRTDLMGMLLLISPPGYGKTTLMEYLANRLGLIFMKINGPALGHGVESLDPEEAPNATARQELIKLNLGLEMGNNVMLYVDDIQHTNPEFLQKFISLCDAQRRIEGVWKGRTKTYDLRGRRFCVVMAGNPYTESGDKFQIPDMLSNRADVYNLGDVLSGKGGAFALSYIENSMTSNAVLAPLATRNQNDVYVLARMAAGEDVPASELEHGYSKVEIEEMVSVLQKLFRCRDVLLAVNANYINSAAQDDRYRTEPKFQLQGSYRNMNKLAEKVVSAMNEQELEALLDDHYQGEAQTLTTGAEANLLKLRELRDVLSDDEAARWRSIKKGFARHQLATGDDDDPVTRVTNQLSAIGAHLDGLREAIERVTEK